LGYIENEIKNVVGLLYFIVFQFFSSYGTL